MGAFPSQVPGHLQFCITAPLFLLGGVGATTISQCFFHGPAPIWNLHGCLNSKWIARYSKSACNRVPIRKIYFRLSERHNLNMDILSPENPFTERIHF